MTSLCQPIYYDIPYSLRKVTMAKLIWQPQQREKILTSSFNERLREPRIGCIIHYDASVSDAGSMSWFRDPRCKVSYSWLVLDDGSYVEIAPKESRAWHAGRCRPSHKLLTYRDANSAFTGIAAATNQRESATQAQLLTIAMLCRMAFEDYGWSIEETWRIVGHDTEGWPRGRKIDPTGDDPRRPIVSIEEIRWLLQRIEL